MVIDNNVTIVVPVMNQLKITEEFLNSISENIIKPYEIIIKDNNSIEDIEGLVSNYKNILNISYEKFSNNIGVNPVWNIGIKQSITNLVGIFNNDIVLNKYFFKMLLETFRKEPKCGIACPNTIANKEAVSKTRNDPVILKTMGKREGWAFTIKRDLALEIGPVPNELITYCGDDFYFFCVREIKKLKAIKMINNYIFHYGGQTVKEKFRGKKTSRISEKQIWAKIRDNLIK